MHVCHRLTVSGLLQLRACRGSDGALLHAANASRLKSSIWQMVTAPARIVEHDEVAKVTGFTTDLLELFGGSCKVKEIWMQCHNGCCMPS